MMTRRTNLVAALAAALLALACEADRSARIGDPCGEDDECESGFCFASVCMDPAGDDDWDGLTNRAERGFGSNPAAADTDGDGEDDPTEIGSGAAPLDTDGDGVFDVLESALLDADGDCLPDELDPDDAGSALDLLIPKVCLVAGVCGAHVGAIAATCGEDGAPRCDYAAVPGWEAEEATCDHADNDCDGETDEGFADADGDGDRCTAGPVCGDDVPVAGVEECDEGARNTDTPCDPGDYPGTCTYCSADCRLVTVAAPPVCGDGIPVAGVEECDEGPANTDTGCDPGPYPGGCDYCTLDCRVETIDAPPVRGDGLRVVDLEECDDGPANTDTPCDPGEYPGTCTYCTLDCGRVTLAAPNPCGDGEYDPGELCDDGAGNTETPCDPTGQESCTWCDPRCQVHVEWEPTILTGVVTDVTRSDLAPVAGAVVAAAGWPPVTTGADGAFTIELRGVTSVVLSVSAPPDPATGTSYTRYGEALAVRPGETVRLQPRLAEGCLGAEHDETVRWDPASFGPRAGCPWLGTTTSLTLPNPVGAPRAEPPPVFAGAGYDGRFRVDVFAVGDDGGLARAVPPHVGESVDGTRVRLRLYAMAEVRAFGGPALDVPLELTPEYVARTPPVLLAESYGSGGAMSAYTFDEARGLWVPRDVTFSVASREASIAIDRLGWWAVAEPYTPDGCVTGVVTLDGAPVAGAEVQFPEGYPRGVESVRTGADGRFCIEGATNEVPDPLLAVYRADGGARHAASFEVMAGFGQCGAPPTECADAGEVVLGADAGQCVQGTFGDIPLPLLRLYQDPGWDRFYRGPVLLAWDGDAGVNRFCGRLPRAGGGWYASDDQDLCAASFVVPEDEGTPGGEDCADPGAECALVDEPSSCAQ